MFTLLDGARKMSPMPPPLRNPWIKVMTMHMNHNLFLDFHFWPPLLPSPSSIWLMNELLEPIGPSDEQDPGTTPVTESSSTSTRKSFLKKMYLIKKIFKNLIAFQKLKGKWKVPDDGGHVDKDESQNGRENDAGPAVSGHSADDVEQRLLAVNDVKQKDGKEKGMGAESKET
jgi:hypothetical protein